MTYFQEVSGLIKDRLTSWIWDDEKKSFIIRSDEEDDKHEQVIKRNHLLFSYDSTTQISKDGLFWNIFDCEEYEWVERLYKSNYYVCRKKGKYGIINDNGDIVVDVVYPLITRFPQIVDIDIDDLYWYESYQKRQERKEEIGENVKPYIVIKITTYDSEYLLELTTMSKSKSYELIYAWGKNYLVEEKGKYGLISPIGDEIISPEYTNAYPINETLSDRYVELIIPMRHQTGGWLEVDYNGKKSVIANNGLFYGEIPLEYDECIYIGKDLINEYMVKKNGKYGLISYNDLCNKFHIDIPIGYKSIHFNEEEPFYTESVKNDNDGKIKTFTFAIVKGNKGYQLFNLRAKDNKIYPENYQSIEFLHAKRRDFIEREPKDPHMFIAKKNNKYGLLSRMGEPITDFIYQSIGPMICNVIPACNDNKWGVLNDLGIELIKCEWDEIKSINRKSACVIKDGKQQEIKIDQGLKNLSGFFDDERKYKLQDPYKGVDMDAEVWDALTDGQYGPYPGGDIDYDIFGF